MCSFLGTSSVDLTKVIDFLLRFKQQRFVLRGKVATDVFHNQSFKLFFLSENVKTFAAFLLSFMRISIFMALGLDCWTKEPT